MLPDMLYTALTKLHVFMRMYRGQAIDLPAPCTCTKCSSIMGWLERDERKVDVGPVISVLQFGSGMRVQAQRSRGEIVECSKSGAGPGEIP